ncbi:tonB-denpendent receptor [Pandoraea terrae]|uniref:TonB-denpendent receptor n=2 Tax=Pandoraea terrae TaxID=1537710 RepID=A0A5E4TGY6_9BURK|nr:tonB-denpendent receptor [Pandoraea terrae]
MYRLTPAARAALTFVGLLAALHGREARAQDAAPAVELPATVVIGTTPLPGLGTPLENVPANVQWIRGKTIDAQHPLNLTDYFEANLDSVSLNSSQGNPYQPDVNYRGFTASPLLGTPQGLSVFQDGVRINESFGDVVNWDLLPPSAIRSVLVVPGSNPLFGLNTLGGALAITTRSGRDSPGGSVAVSGGSFGRRTLEFTQGGRLDKVDYFVTLNDTADNGWADHNASRVKQAFGKLGYADADTTANLSVTAADNALHGAQTIPRSFLDNFRQAYTFPDRNLNRATFFNLNGSHFFNEQVELSVNAYYRKFFNENVSSNVNGEFGSVDPDTGSVNQVQANNARSIVEQDSYGLGLQLTLLGHVASMDNQFVVGASGDFANARFSQYGQDALFTPQRDAVGLGGFALRTDAKTHNSNAGVFVTDTLSLTDQLAVTASARYHHAQTTLADQTGNQPLLNGSHTFSRLNPALGITYNPSPGVTAYANYSEGMRAPTAIELACADPAAPCSLPNDFIADPALRPVLSKTVEAGVRGQFGTASSWRAAVFRTDLDNDIAFISSNTATAATGFFQNVGKTRRQGIELSLATHAGPVGVTASYSYIDATYRTSFIESSRSNSSADANGNITVRPGNRIPGVARHTVKMRLDYNVTPQWEIGTNLVYHSAVFARGDENNQDAHGQIGAYAMLDVDTTWHVTKRLDVFARVNNVFDRRYANFGTLARNVFTGPGHTFGGGNAVSEQFVGVGAPRGIWVGLRYAWR